MKNANKLGVKIFLLVKDSEIFDGSQIFYNYIRSHMGLNGKTPAEACGIEIKGKDKWITLIQNSMNNK